MTNTPDLPNPDSDSPTTTDVEPGGGVLDAGTYDRILEPRRPTGCRSATAPGTSSRATTSGCG
jgi:hypothetical protein